MQTTEERRESSDYLLGRAAGESGIIFPKTLIPNLDTTENMLRALGYLEGAIAYHNKNKERKPAQEFRGIDVPGYVLIK